MLVPKRAPLGACFAARRALNRPQRPRLASIHPLHVSPAALLGKRGVSKLTPKDLIPKDQREAAHDLTFEEEVGRVEHAVISTFDLFSIGVGPSSSHTVGPLRAAKIFIMDLKELGVLEQVETLKITLYGSLAATGKGHMTPQALMMGFEGSDAETVDTSTIDSRYQAILDNKILVLNGAHRIKYDMNRDMVWRFDQVLPTHPNGMRFSVFDANGDLLATNEYYSVGGGFVVNEKTKVDENLFYKGVDKKGVDIGRLSLTHGAELGALPPPGSEAENTSSNTDEASQREVKPRYLFHNAASLLAMTKRHNLTIAQLVYENELHYMTHEEVHDQILQIWSVMDDCIRSGVSSREEVLPGRLGLARRAPKLYRRLMKGFYPTLSTPDLNAPAIASPGPEIPDVPLFDALSAINSSSARAAPESDVPPASPFASRLSASPKTPLQKRRSQAPRVMGRFDHPIPPMPSRKAVFPGVDFLSCYAIAVNEVNAAGGRIVTSPTNGASGVIPAVLKYIVEFISDDPERDIFTFLLTASAIGMLFKRGSTISAAEGCQAEVGVACSMAAAGFSACMGASPEIILQAAEIGIEHNLGLTCDPIDGLVQVPCIERNSLGAVKAVTAAQLAMASDGVYSVSLDEAIAAMRMTADDMSHKYKETSLGGLATTVLDRSTNLQFLWIATIVACLPDVLLY
ncbi:L-serine ammonia-lyase [Clavulina sp. PMI_390]|nr:L-serine ammonia-lyase [Clavulina sp. PMI_390]